MAISKVEIFNITLNILGVANPVENINIDDSKTVLLNNYYNLARDYVLKDFDWNFASNFKSLTLNNNTSPQEEFKYCYDYPNDCICARDIFEKGNYRLEKFKVASLSGGHKIILTNANSAVLRYTQRIDKEMYFPCEFTTALSYYLASLTSSVISGNIQKGELAFEKYTKLIKRAKYLNAQEGIDEIYKDETYIDSRY